ncbi:hypothetical protein [Bradyrhizobium elkanii]|uniref:hypothetical protein n=1 Tax=Bradyrhizobium elkanii TaxID=29448 RepID=UPI0026826FB8
MMVRLAAVLLAYLVAISVAVAQPADSSPSWNDGAAKSAISEFVARVTTQGGRDLVPPIFPPLATVGGAKESKP